MKNRLFITMLIVFVALLTGVFSSCSADRNDPILYVINGTDYSVSVYCDNYLVASASAHNNSGKVVLSHTSVNLPVYVEAEFYDSKGKRVTGYQWNSFKFSWNKSYKMTLTNSASTSSLKEL